MESAPVFEGRSGLARRDTDKSEEEKQRLAERITDNLIAVFQNGVESISVALEEVDANERPDNVYKPDFLHKPEHLYKQPGYAIDVL